MNRLAKISLLAYLGLLIISGCSNPTKEYAKLEKFQFSKEDLIKQNIEYDLKIKACDEVLDSLNVFLVKHKNDEWHQKVMGVIDTWKTRRVEIENDREFEKEFNRLGQLQSSKEQFLQKSYDTGIKMQACGEVLDSLNAFLSRHKEDRWGPKAIAAIAVWNTHQTIIEHEKGTIARDNDYDKVMKIQQASEQSQSYTSDFDLKIKSCEDVVNSINGFLSKYSQDESKPILLTALRSWENRKATFEQEKLILYSQAYELNKRQAANAAAKVHQWSEIENMMLSNRDEQKNGKFILITDTYSVRMRGRIVGTNIFKLEITTSSTISMDTKSVESSGNPSVTE